MTDELQRRYRQSDGVFDHEPPGCDQSHAMTLWTDWATDEPLHLTCDPCDAMWTIGPRVPRVARHGVKQPDSPIVIMDDDTHRPVEG